MSRRNRVDPWGDLHAVSSRGLITGNRGCLVDNTGELVRHHNGSLWISCQTEYKDWKHPLEDPGTWTPLFFLDDAVALAAGHRPCGLCRRPDYLSFQRAVTSALSTGSSILAPELNRRVAAERHRRGRGLVRAQDRILWTSTLESLPVGSVILNPLTRQPNLVAEHYLQPFSFEEWGKPMARPQEIEVEVLTPPTSIAALAHGFVPLLHSSAAE
jgi:hypothetical protein